jgi:proteasome accessory factor B
VHTVSRKSERLVNLTIALLATKRFLTKDEIFRSIEGYEGSDESKERMFERDKDDLRSLGIEIEVGGLDPLFNDEAGYRIKPDSYKLDLGEISGTDIALLALAAEAWNGAALGDAANSALVKLKSMGIDSDLDLIPTLAPRIAWSSQELETVLEAISKTRKIVFNYLSSEMQSQQREIFPYAVATQNGLWYFSGLDCHKDEQRALFSDS